MKDLDFELAFSDFLDREEYDDAQASLFSMVRTAFVAGWLAAGGEPLPAQRPFTLYRNQSVDAID